ncbi:jg12380 [Pararge aegeria aegeria]|uniref:Jg12380 protein n=1 Tax=Pararge aegeria aegeria TaxID=348720 RepID=A0A8S4S7E2_9NEOP|nr:jg12380 [Pararge aegeria aegeria]
MSQLSILRDEEHSTPFFPYVSVIIDVQVRILSFFGHVSRRNDVSIERLVVQGKVEGTRARGRSPMRWTDQVKATIEAPLHECARKATVREEWRSIVKRGTTPR